MLNVLDVMRETIAVAEKVIKVPDMEIRIKIFNSFKEFLLLSRIFGSAILSFDRKKFRFTVPRYARFYGIFLLLAFVAITTYVFSVTVPRNQSKMSPKARLVDLFNVFLAYVACLVSNVRSISVSEDKVESFFRSFIRVDNILLVRNSDEYRKTKKLIITQMLLLIICIIAIYVYNLWQMWEILGFIFFCPALYSYFVNIIIVLQFSNITYILQRRFKLLNISLERVLDFESDNRIINHSNSVSICLKLRALRDLRRAHFTLCSMCSVVNRVYGIQNLVGIASSFASLVGFTYMAVLGILYTKQLWEGKDRHTVVTMYTLWTIVQIFKITCVTFCADKCQAEGNHTLEIVNKLTMGLELNTAEEEKGEAVSVLLRQLKLFQQQLMNGPISFTAAGFFNIEKSLLHSVTGAVTTYLVILVQLGGSSESDNNDSK